MRYFILSFCQFLGFPLALVELYILLAGMTCVLLSSQRLWIALHKQGSSKQMIDIFDEEFFMQLGKVVGTVVSTCKDEKLEGLKLYIVKYINTDGTPTGALVIAVDSVGSGVGEVVLVASGSSARQTNITKDKPVDTVIMAIVDSLEINGKTVYSKSESDRSA